MFIVLWEYLVKPESRSEFEVIYSPNGTWAELFKKDKGYLGTELLRDETNLQRYLTIDYWNSKDDYELFQSQHREEYKALDTQCINLTEIETMLGKWETP